MKEMLIKCDRSNNLQKKSNNKVLIKFAENLGAVIDFSTKMTSTMLQSYQLRLLKSETDDVQFHWVQRFI